MHMGNPAAGANVYIQRRFANTLDTLLCNRTHDIMQLHSCATRLRAAMCVQEKERHIIDVTSSSENSCLVLAGIM